MKGIVHIILDSRVIMRTDLRSVPGLAANSFCELGERVLVHEREGIQRTRNGGIHGWPVCLLRN
jgi:hypothetical protein